MGTIPQTSQVVRELKERGALCLPGFFDPASVEEMRTEAIALLGNPTEGGQAEAHPGGAAVRIDPTLLAGPRFPGLARALRSEFFLQIAHGYDPKSRFCVDAVITHDTIPCKITDTHYDTRRSLKFMIYLRDVGKENAAFRYGYGSHRPNREDRHRFLLAGGKLNDLPNIPGRDETVALADIEGPEGTLIIFETDGFHSAGVLQPGKERLLVRSRTLLSGWFNHAVLRHAARLNPMRFLFPYRVLEGRKATGGSARAMS